MGLSQSALVSVRGSLPEGFHADVESQECCGKWRLERKQITAYAGAVRWPRLVSAASSVQRGRRETMQSVHCRCRCNCSEGSRPWRRQNACQHRRRSEWFQRQAAQGSPSSKQQAAASASRAYYGLRSTVYRCAGSRAALALARLTAWTLGRGRLLNVPQVGQATLDSAREEPGRLAAAASRRASSVRTSLSGLRCAALSAEDCAERKSFQPSGSRWRFDPASTVLSCEWSAAPQTAFVHRVVRRTHSSRALSSTSQDCTPWSPPATCHLHLPLRCPSARRRPVVRPMLLRGQPRVCRCSRH